MTIRLVVADDHQIFREGLCAMLGNESEIELLGQADSGLAVVELVRDERPDVVIMDITMPGMSGMQATREVKRVRPETAVVALSIHGDRHFVAEMFKAGASGYLLKMCAFEELVTAIQTVAGGKKYVSPAIADVVIDGYTNGLPEDEVSPLAELTDRETEVLQLLAEGKGSKEIGLLLHVSSKTVDNHRRSLMEKLDLHSLPELTKFAIRTGLTPLDE